MSIFTGSGVAIITPMKEDFSVNYEALENLINFQIDNGTDAIIICGTTGESSTLSHDEHDECIRFTVEKVNKRVPVIAGTGSNSTAEAIDLSIKATKAGVDGLLIVTPYYNKCTQDGLVEYYSDIANAVGNTPIIMYNVPSRTGCNILPETAIKIAKKCENVVAIKEASGNIEQVIRLAALSEGCIDIYSGNDDQIVPLMSLGGKGVISVLANVEPRKTHDIVAKYIEGDVKESLRLQLEAYTLIKALFCEVNPIPVKAAVELMNMNAGPLRKPLTTITEEHKEQLIQAMKKNNLI